jgi:hypothetical protein
MIQAQNRILMWPPYHSRPSIHEIPQHNPSIGIATEQPTIVSEKVQRMNLDRMAAKNV